MVWKDKSGENGPFPSLPCIRKRKKKAEKKFMQQRQVLQVMYSLMLYFQNW